MKNMKLNPLLLIGAIGFFTIGSQFAAQIGRAYWGNQDIWWTPRNMQLPIQDTQNHFRLFISGKRLQGHLDDGTLFAVDSRGDQYRVVSKDITVRLNNWCQVKTSILGHALMLGVPFGIVLTLLTVGLFQTFGKKRNPDNRR
ncbi:MAG: hypothetical protein K9M96_10170 [Deltaproteobacteria bacterium]|nr:hypothetical protein [Deltaproteobacteria bacterium]MCF8119047.1 hypothetical protein [Deltaproteobacteria bacterium]